MSSNEYGPLGGAAHDCLIVNTAACCGTYHGPIVDGTAAHKLRVVSALGTEQGTLVPPNRTFVIIVAAWSLAKSSMIQMWLQFWKLVITE